MTCRPDEWIFIAEGKETLEQLHPTSEDVTTNIKRLVFAIN